MRAFLRLVLFGLLLVPGLSAAGGPGSVAGSGLKLSTGARPEGMGGAFVGLADDVSALFWNPAGLANLTASEVSVMHTSYLADTSYEVAAYTFPVSVLGTGGIGVNLLDYGDLPRTLEQPDGLYGGTSGNTAPQDIYLVGGWGMGLPGLLGLSSVKVGGNVKMTFQQLSGGTLVGMGVAGGLIWDTPVRNLRIGTVGDNIGGVAREGRALPMTWRAGASWGANVGRDVRFVLTGESQVALDTDARGNMGGEVVAYEVLAIRGGWREGGAQGGPTFGLGIMYPMSWLRRDILVKFDYASSYHGELGVAHLFQLGMQFGGYSNVLSLQYMKKLEEVDEPVMVWKGKGKSYNVMVLHYFRVVEEEGEPVLVWEGKGEAYHVLMRRSDAEPFVQLTDRPLSEPRFPLLGLEPGRYRFVIVMFNRYKPDEIAGTSREVELLVGEPQE